MSSHHKVPDVRLKLKPIRHATSAIGLSDWNAPACPFEITVKARGLNRGAQHGDGRRAADIHSLE